jgi:DNA repair protein RecO (recombination protein O)
MRVSEKALILQSIKHGDKKYILKLFSQHHGMLTAAVNVGQSKTAKIRTSAVMPLNFVEAELIFKENKDIHLLTELNVYKAQSDIHQHMSKLSIAQFMHEVMIKTLKDQHGHADLFKFIEECFDFLNEAREGYSNLHLYFLMELSKHLGFEPQNNLNSSSLYFDVREGRFTETAMVWPFGLGKEDSVLFSQVLKFNLLAARFSREEKHLLLDVFLNYFAFHIPGFGILKSPEILKEVFND